ncbi:MAG: hypothetical protein JST80_04695 [Bdellovibrionales bacterium]|nr:hypothetical protein [Bdellovibrionales bacterium]
MKKFILIAAVLFCSASSYAIDQITLSTGEVIEGKVLADVPNRHVDIELINGEKRRYPKSQVTNVERDVPSNKDRAMYGVDRRFFFGPTAGGLVSTDGGDVQFEWGVKVGANAANMGGAQFAPTFSFHRFQTSTLGVSASLNYLNAEFLFRRISNSGFYIGPQIGLAITSASWSSFIAGAVLGYDMQISDGFSIGPDVKFDHFFAVGGGNTITFGLDFLLYFE